MMNKSRLVFRHTVLGIFALKRGGRQARIVFIKGCDIRMPDERVWVFLMKKYVVHRKKLNHEGLAKTIRTIWFCLLSIHVILF